MTGKTVLITGGTGGIGRAAAVALASIGARVGITGRDAARAAADAIANETGNHAIDTFVADMSSQTEIRRLADEVLAAYPRLDVLLNNVGEFWSHRHVTADGLEHTFALNHLAPFLLTNLLLERLIASAPARIVTISSGAQSMGRIDFDDPMGERTYSGQQAYNQSKLANVMFTYELAARLAGTGVTAMAVHPGMTNTSFSRDDLSLRLRSARDGHASVHAEAGPRAPCVLRQLARCRAFDWAVLHRSRIQAVKRGRIRSRCDGPVWRMSAELVGLVPDAPANSVGLTARDRWAPERMTEPCKPS